tara:strand:+ start:2842 stop:3687 length:846 start_codon:yes stop_codon:yes gene_type:complete
MEEKLLVTIPVNKQYKKNQLKLINQINIDHFVIPQISSVRTDAFSLAFHIKKHLNKTMILTINTVDTNLRFIQSRILGAKLFDIVDFIITKGDSHSLQKSREKREKDSKSIFEFPTTKVIKHVSNMKNGSDFLGNKITKIPKLHLGSTIELNNVTEQNINLVNKKIKYGIKYFISNPIYDSETYTNFVTEYKKFTNKIFETDVYISIRMDLPKIVYYDKEFNLDNYKNQNITKENFYLKLVSNFKDNNLNKFNFILPSIDYDPIEMKNQISLINKLVKNIN